MKLLIRFACILGLYAPLELTRLIIWYSETYAVITGFYLELAVIWIGVILWFYYIARSELNEEHDIQNVDRA